MEVLVFFALVLFFMMVVGMLSATDTTNVANQADEIKTAFDDLDRYHKS